MSMGPLNGIVASAAGASLAKRTSDTQRQAKETSDRQRTTQMADHAELAAGVGQTDGEGHEAHERDADGRRLWEAPPKRHDGKQPEETDQQGNPPPGAADSPGAILDLSG